MIYMKKNLTFVLFGVLVAVASCSFTNKSFENDDKDKLLLDLITYVLNKGHYEPKVIDDDFSVSVFEDFIDELDPTKRYFLESDIKEFEQQKFQIDDQIKNTDITFFNMVYDRLMKRIDEAKIIYKEVLEQPFDFYKDEEISIEYKEVPFAASRQELKERWRQQLKYATLNTYDSKLTSGHVHSPDEDPDFHLNDIVAEEDEPMAPKEAEISARQSTRKTLDEYFDFIADVERKDWFVQYINTIVDEFDPHTFYFAPEEKEKFDTSMSRKFEGIGARLQKKNEGAMIMDIISGGPVWRDARIEVGDIIVKVAQKGEEPIDIVGMRLDDAIKMMIT